MLHLIGQRRRVLQDASGRKRKNCLERRQRARMQRRCRRSLVANEEKKSAVDCKMAVGSRLAIKMTAEARKVFLLLTALSDEKAKKV